MKKKQDTETNAISMLEAQHREVEELFEKFEEVAEDEGDPETAMSIAAEVCRKLTLHATIEEELFYPAVTNEETSDLLKEAAVEHVSAKRLISDIQALAEGDDTLKAMMSVLQEQIEHHVEEEEGTLFPQVAESMEAEELSELGERMQQRLSVLEEEDEGVSDKPDREPAAKKVKVTSKKSATRNQQSNA